MKNIGDILKGKDQIGVHKEIDQLINPNSAHGEQIELLMLLMGDKLTDRQKYRYWCGRTRKMTVEQIFRMIMKAKEGKNPPALFNYLLKQHNESLKNS